MTSPPPSFGSISQNQKEISKTTSKANKEYNRYVLSLKNQFDWLEKYLPADRLNHFFHLVAFYNFNRKSIGPTHLQLRDLFRILALWDLELTLSGKSISNDTLAQMDTFMCDQTPEFRKHGLISRSDVLIHKQEILYGLIDSDEEMDIFCKKNKLSSTVKKRIRNLLSLSIIPS